MSTGANGQIGVSRPAGLSYPETLGFVLRTQKHRRVFEQSGDMT